MRTQGSLHYFLIPIFLSLPLISWAGARSVKSVIFNINCGDYIKRAADSNTVEMAIKELQTVIAYADKHGSTTGYTSVFYQGPSEDVGFWYNNLKSSLNELKKVTPETTQLEKTNILIKLRETLLDRNNSGDVVTVPPGISIYPYNTAYALWGIVALVLCIIGWIKVVYDIHPRY